MASVYDLIFTRGTSISLNLVAVNPATNERLNLSGYNVRSYIRNNYSSTGILLDLAPVITSYVSGIININKTGESTALLPCTRGVWDCEVYNSDGYVLKLLGGRAYCEPEATR